MSQIGHNKPPSMTITAADTTVSLNDWLKENPVIEGEESARAAKILIDRGKLCIKDLEDERDSEVRPLNQRVKEINTYYASSRELLRKVTDEVSQRLRIFILGEESRRQEVFRQARKQAEESERLAREAEAREREALEASTSGELGVDIAGATSQADQSFSDYQKDERAAKLAEKETKVKITSPFGRATSLRPKETILVTDYLVAVRVLGPTDRILEAIEKDARAFRQIHGELPAGVQSVKERGI